MADYSKSKPVVGSVYPLNVINTAWGRLEPLLTVDQLKTRFLFGIPLVLKQKGPDGKPMQVTDAMLLDYINIAVDTAELESGCTIMPDQYSQKMPYSRQDFESFGYMQLPHKPISSIESFTVRLASEEDLFIFPTAWIEVANLIAGQLSLIPLAFQNVTGGGAVIGGNIAPGASGAFFNSLWNRNWVSALFNVTYTAGFKDGLFPRVINELIGCIAAMKLLSQLAASRAHQANSTSVGIDGINQSISGPGVQIYKLRLEELAEQRDMLKRKIMKLFGMRLVISNV